MVAQFDSTVGAVPNTTLIAGPKEGGGYTVWTFHPGDPAPMGVEITMDTVLERFPTGLATVADAIELGFNFVKRVDRIAESRAVKKKC